MGARCRRELNRLTLPNGIAGEVVNIVKLHENVQSSKRCRKQLFSFIEKLTFEQTTELTKQLSDESLLLYLDCRLGRRTMDNFMDTVSQSLHKAKNINESIVRRSAVTARGIDSSAVDIGGRGVDPNRQRQYQQRSTQPSLIERKASDLRSKASSLEIKRTIEKNIRQQNFRYFTVTVKLGVEAVLTAKGADGKKVIIGLEGTGTEAKVAAELETKYFKVEAELDKTGVNLAIGKEWKDIFYDLDVEIKFSHNPLNPISIALKPVSLPVKNLNVAGIYFDGSITLLVTLGIMPNYIWLATQVGSRTAASQLGLRIAGGLLRGGQAIAGAGVQAIAVGGVTLLAGVAAVGGVLYWLGSMSLAGKAEGAKIAFANGYAEMFNRLLSTNVVQIINLEMFKPLHKTRWRKEFNKYSDIIENNPVNSVKSQAAMRILNQAGQAAALQSVKMFLQHFGLPAWREVVVYHRRQFDINKANKRYGSQKEFLMYVDDVLKPQIRNENRILGIPPLMDQKVDLSIETSESHRKRRVSQ